MRPPDTTAIISAFLTVESRWATTMVVRPTLARSRASWTSRSLRASRADVASSRSKIDGRRTRALAMAILCFCPPDSIAPRSPMTVSYCSGSFMMKSWQFAIFAASMMSSIDGSFSENERLPLELVVASTPAPSAMFSLIEVANKVGIWATSPILDRSHRTLSSFNGLPSRSTLPPCGS
mmetsp:Transcript_9271/g.18898  ORF Transcript_9271/g.18898 Transcript_9271/m.18898 type:complete len:179 (+) Transcript_9271:2940-3476(+)